MNPVSVKLEGGPYDGAEGDSSERVLNVTEIFVRVDPERSKRPDHLRLHCQMPGRRYVMVMQEEGLVVFRDAAMPVTVPCESMAMGA